MTQSQAAIPSFDFGATQILTRRHLLGRVVTLSAMAALPAVAAVTGAAATPVTICPDAGLVQLASDWMALDRAWLAAEVFLSNAQAAAWADVPEPEALRFRDEDFRLINWWGPRQRQGFWPFWTDPEIEALQDSGSSAAARKNTPRGRAVLAAWAGWKAETARAERLHGVPQLTETSEALCSKKRGMFQQLIELPALTQEGLLAKVAALAQFLDPGENELADGIAEGEAHDTLMMLSVARDARGLGLLAGASA